MKYILDTDTLIYYFNNDHDVIYAMKKAGHKNLYITHITQGELIFGAHNSAKKNQNLKKLWRFFPKINKLPISNPVIDNFGKIKADLVATGKKVNDHDIWIGAFGKAYKMTVVTNNDKHFCRFKGLKTANWRQKNKSSIYLP